ncbi:hypothetical protein KO500_13135 [Cellulophaga baltica]|uniref:hypothetical protein n=1 Tax=Cellulophaga TaxID=104264 RepID=UPI001C065EAA|nr:MULTISPECIES: hypothetical protein [Cellulophaga]MBU2997385.1 hypothetical protein [Cellulophaga baltica]MDO6768782.1 hypothetical protein [Cellulophaga sp. 1_MG-2023]
MITNKKIVLVVALFFATITFYGQHDVDRDKIKALKIAYITEHLDFSSKEAQEFWPVYNDFEEKKNKLRKLGHSEVYSQIKNSDNLSDSDATKLLEKYTKYQAEKNDLEESYTKKMKTIISAKKTLLLLRTEDDFKRQLIKQYRDKNKK